MEDALTLVKDANHSVWVKSLNPCFNGRCTHTY